MSLLTSRLGRGPSWVKALPVIIETGMWGAPTTLVEHGKDAAAGLVQGVALLMVAIGRAARAAILGVSTLLLLSPEVALPRSAVRLLAPCGWAWLLGGSTFVSCCWAVGLQDASCSCYSPCCCCSCERDKQRVLLLARLRARLRALREQRNRVCSKQKRCDKRWHPGYGWRECCRWRRNRNDQFAQSVGQGVARKLRRARSRNARHASEDKGWFWNAVGRFRSWCGGVFQWLYGGEADAVIQFMA